MHESGPLTATERQSYRLGCQCFERGDDESALSHFTCLLETRDEYADIHYRVGVLLERKDDMTAAAESLTKAIRINPAYSEARLALASIYERQGDFDRSRAVASPVADAGSDESGVLDPTTRGKLANLQAEMGDAYRDAGELRDAIEAYRKALDRCPGYHDIRFRLGIVLRDSGLPSQALSEFRRVLRANPSYLDAQIQLGLTLYTLGRSEDAIRNWSSVLDSDPTHRDARMYMRLVQNQSGARE